MAAIILDDSSSIFDLQVGDFSTLSNGNYYGGFASFLTPPPSDPSGVMILSALFLGTSITIYGSVTQNFSASLGIDEADQSEIQLVVTGQGALYDVIYRSPDLSDARNHSLNFFISSKGAGIYLDYATVSVTENTTINGRRLIVDENDASIVFEGDWALNRSILRNPVDGFLRRPHGNTTHQTSSSGTSVLFSFNGTSVSVYGANLLSPSQTLEVLYTMDGLETASELKFYGSENSTNFQWYEKDDLSPATHTLNVTVSYITKNASFILDYILYTPSFSSFAEEKGLTKQQASSSMSQPSSRVTGPLAQVSIVPPPGHPSISRRLLIGVIIGPVLFGIVLALILLVTRRRKLLFWSSKQRSNTVAPFPPPSQNQGFSQLHVYHKSSTVNGQNVQIPIPEHDLPLAGPSDGVLHTRRRARWWARIWRRSEPRIMEAFPPDWNPTSSNQPMVQRKPPLPSTLSAQRQASRQSATSSANETIVADPRVQQLEELVVSLQQEIEETRQVYGVQNGALMRELIEGHSESANEHSQQEHHRVSMTMSATVV